MDSCAAHESVGFRNLMGGPRGLPARPSIGFQLALELGVVDHRCRVFKRDGGVQEGLHVMDSSTYSSPIAVNTSLTAAAIAERAMSLLY